MEIAITKMSSKGQVVIPIEMRKNIHNGEKLIIIQNGEQIILKKAGKMDKDLEDDLLFAKRTEEALKRYKAGKFTEMSSNEFDKEVNKW
jgi:AbrB family looped-hinge helix DNA binding protein